MKYFLIAGEASGDLHGANLMKALKMEDAAADFRFLGGDKMKAQSDHLLVHYQEMAFMGFVEVLFNLSKISKNLKIAKEAIRQYQPDVVILIDFPGFNLKMASFAKKLGFKTFYYIAPKVWAWNTKRVYKIKKVVDHLFCILPFEIPFFKTYKLKASYIGNPILDEIKQFKSDPSFLSEIPSTKKIIALLPGSREQEIRKMLPAMLSVVNQFPDDQFVIAATHNFSIEYYQQFIKESQVKIVFNKTYDLLQLASFALVASGTATLETALFKVPQVVLYIGHPITVFLGRKLIKIKFISLVNIILNRLLVKELIQEECDQKHLHYELENLKLEATLSKVQKGYHELAEIMGTAGASEKAAKLMFQELNNKI